MELTPWETQHLGSVLTLQRGFDLPKRLRRHGAVPIVTSSGVEDYHDAAKVKSPGVVTGRYVFFITEDFWPLNTTLYVRDFHGNDPLFVSYLLRTIDFHTHSEKSGVPGVNRNDLHEIAVAVPRSRAEQEAIADALYEADALVESLEQLLYKKRQIKEGAMHELLTGKRRLQGFSQQWLRVRFGDVVAPRKERIEPGKLAPSTLCIELEDIEQATGRICVSAERSTSVSPKTPFQPGDVLFGKLRAYLRKYWLANRTGVCSTEIWVLVAKPGLAHGYLAQVVQMVSFVDAASTSYGTHMPRSDWQVVKNYELFLPPEREQEAIASLLAALDGEILAMEHERAKLHQIKQGMMQNLLTGRIRLVDAKASNDLQLVHSA